MEKITVLMAVFNTDSEELKQSVSSILNQTYKNFDFLIIDDGSNLETKTLLNSIKKCDPRVHIHTNSKNIGLINSLNLGLKLSKTKYVARMDSDDWSFPTRLEEQMNYLHHHLDVSVLGTNAIWMDNEQLIHKTKICSHEDIVATLPFYCCIVHPTAILNREDILKIGDYPQVFAAEDYALWAKICFDSSLKINVLPSALLKYRRYNSATKYKGKQSKSDIFVKSQIIKKILRLDQCPEKENESFYEKNIKAVTKEINKNLTSPYSKALILLNAARAKKNLLKLKFQQKQISAMKFGLFYFSEKAKIFYLTSILKLKM